MSLPEGVSTETEGRQLFVTQRGYFAEHFSSCMFAALCSILTWMGYRLPLARKKINTPPENFVHLLHVTSGAPLDRGTKIKHTRQAMRELLPDAEVLYGRLSDDEFLEELRNGAAIRVTATLSDLPARLQKVAGSSNRGHAFCVIGTRMCHGDVGSHSDHNGVREIFWMDPMGRPSTGYKGDWISWDSVRPHLRRRGGDIVVTLATRTRQREWATLGRPTGTAWSRRALVAEPAAPMGAPSSPKLRGKRSGRCSTCSAFGAASAHSRRF